MKFRVLVCQVVTMRFLHEVLFGRWILTIKNRGDANGTSPYPLHKGDYVFVRSFIREVHCKLLVLSENEVLKMMKAGWC